MWRIEVGLPLCKGAAQTLTLAMQDVHKQQTENYCANVVLQKLMCHAKNQQRYKKLCVGTVYFYTPHTLVAGYYVFTLAVRVSVLCSTSIHPSAHRFRSIT